MTQDTDMPAAAPMPEALLSAEDVAGLVERLKSSAEAFRKYPVYTVNGASVFLTAPADQLAKAATTIITLAARVEEAEREKAPTTEKRAPVQGFAAGIPWSMHLRAYDVYAKKYGAQQALIDLEGRGCRGGFSTGELDMFIPGWRDDLSETTALKASLEKVTAERDEAIKLMSQYAREAGEAKGRLEMSEAAGIVDGWRERCEAAEAQTARMRKALEPSAETKAAYMGEFRFRFPAQDPEGNEVMFTPTVPWTTIKEIMAAIRAQAALSPASEGGE